MEEAESQHQRRGHHSETNEEETGDPWPDEMELHVWRTGLLDKVNGGRNYQASYSMKWLKEILSVQFYKILSTYNAKIKIILYTFLKFDNKN